MARLARSGSAAPEMTPQDWAIESIRHSSLDADPSGVPSSKKARRYQSPSQPVPLESDLQRGRVRPPAARPVRLAARLGEAREVPEIRAEEPAEPDALALAAGADPIHPVVPVAASHQGQPVAAGREAAVERPRAVLEERRRLSGNLRFEIAFRLFRLERRAREKRNRLVEDGVIARDLDVVVHGVGEPEQVVGDPGPHAFAGRFVPPVLDVSLLELPRRGPQQVGARQLAPRDRERHGVLELVAKSPRAPCLVEGRTRPEAAGERLIKEPAVQHQVHRPVGRADLKGGERVFPLAPDGAESGVEVPANESRR